MGARPGTWLPGEYRPMKIIDDRPLETAAWRLTFKPEGLQAGYCGLRKLGKHK
jgi:hypothetical protein